MKRFVILMMSLVAPAPVIGEEVEAIPLDKELLKRMGHCASVASNEYYIKLPESRIPPGESRAFDFTLPGADGGQVPCAALMLGLEFRVSDPGRRGWRDVEAKDLAITVKVPGSDGPATYTMNVPFDHWRRPIFPLPVGPGDDVATGKWQVTIENKSRQPIQQSRAWIRMLLRFD